MIDYSLFRFAAPSNTEANWIIRAASSVGLSGIGNAFFPFDPGSKSPSLTLVCHPCDWLARRFCSDNFDDTIRNILDSDPCYASEMFSRFKADIALRVEDLPGAFAEFLESLGIQTAKKVFLCPLHIPTFVDWNPSLRARIVEAEHKFMEKYEYV